MFADLNRWSSSETFESVSGLSSSRGMKASHDTGPQRFEPPLCVKDTNSLHQDLTCRSWRICLTKPQERLQGTCQLYIKGLRNCFYSPLSKRKSWKKKTSLCFAAQRPKHPCHHRSKGWFSPECQETIINWYKSSSLMRVVQLLGFPGNPQESYAQSRMF